MNVAGRPAGHSPVVPENVIKVLKIDIQRGNNYAVGWGV